MSFFFMTKEQKEALTRHMLAPIGARPEPQLKKLEESVKRSLNEPKVEVKEETDVERRAREKEKRKEEREREAYEPSCKRRRAKTDNFVYIDQLRPNVEREITDAAEKKLSETKAKQQAQQQAKQDQQRKQQLEQQQQLQQQQQQQLQRQLQQQQQNIQVINQQLRPPNMNNFNQQMVRPILRPMTRPMINPNQQTNVQHLQMSHQNQRAAFNNFNTQMRPRQQMPLFNSNPNQPMHLNLQNQLANNIRPAQMNQTLRMPSSNRNLLPPLLENPILIPPLNNLNFQTQFNNLYQIPSLMSKNLTMISPNLNQNLANINIKNNKNPIAKPIPKKLSVYSNPKYNFSQNHRYEKLPIINYKDEIIESLEKNNIIIIQGNTGSGKTTQVPQLILDHHAKKNQHCNIIVTQPRRIAAISICERVCQTRNWNVGSICGYQIGMDKRVSRDTRITYATNGCLVQKLIGNRERINKYTHIILDEIHDRELETDLVILLMKIILLEKFNGKLILMSATLNPSQLQNYFRLVSTQNRVPVIICESRPFDVELFYLDDLIPKLNIETELPNLDPSEPELSDEYIEIVPKLLEHFDQIEIENDPNGETINGFPCHRGSVLIFAPGYDEIYRIDSLLRRSYAHLNLEPLVLHSEIPRDQQMKVFKKPVMAVRKVIISTSIAESSITVRDIKYVIDFGLTKSLHCEIFLTGCSVLKLEWASKSNMLQRKGRAGRVANGKCYRLMTNEFYQNSIKDFPDPAILRQPLDKYVLYSKRIDANRPPKEILSLALTPPGLDEIERTILILKEAGALSLYKNGEFCKDDGELTYAGEIMSELPVDIKLGKLILFGHIFGKLNDAIIIASALSVKSIFSRYYKSDMEFFSAKYYWSEGLFSDFNIILAAYNVWKSNLKKKDYGIYKDEEHWAFSHYIGINRMRELENIKMKIEHRLKQHNIFVEKEQINLNEFTDPTTNALLDDKQAVDRHFIIKFMVCGAFYPNYFITYPADPENVERTLIGKNPMTTVLLKGIPNDEGVLYQNEFERIFKIWANDVTISYDNDKAYVELTNRMNHLRTKISFGVYACVALRAAQVKLEFSRAYRNENYRILSEIMRMKGQEGSKYKTSSTNRLTISALDTLNDPNILLKGLNEFDIEIIEVTDFGQFWARVNESKYKQNFETMQKVLNYAEQKLTLIDKKYLQIGNLVATTHFDDDFNLIVCRARILNLTSQYVEVLLIDFGKKEKKDFNLIFDLKKINESYTTTCHQAFECELANIRIDPLKANNLLEMRKALNEFKKILDTSKTGKLKAKVYSIIDNKVRLSLFERNKLFLEDISLKLIKLQLCQKCEESLISQRRHEERMNVVNYKNSQKSGNDWIVIKNLESLLKSVKFDHENKFELKNSPYSPLEVNLTSLPRCLERKRVCIDHESINHVLLDEEPNVDCPNLLISHRIDISERNDNLILRNTCLMPKIRGLVSLCLLMFSPTCELRIDPKKKTYTGGLFGLGYDKRLRKPLYMENDIENVFDVEFDFNYLKKINSLRALFNIVIGNKEEYESRLLNDPEKFKKVRHDANKLVLELLRENRKPIKPTYFDRTYHWNQIPESNYMQQEEIRKMRRKLVHNKAFYLPIGLVNFDKIQ